MPAAGPDVVAPLAASQNGVARGQQQVDAAVAELRQQVADLRGLVTAQSGLMKEQVWIRFYVTV